MAEKKEKTKSKEWDKTLGVLGLCLFLGIMNALMGIGAFAAWIWYCTLCDKEIAEKERAEEEREEKAHQIYMEEKEKSFLILKNKPREERVDYIRRWIHNSSYPHTFSRWMNLFPEDTEEARKIEERIYDEVNGVVITPGSRDEKGRCLCCYDDCFGRGDKYERVINIDVEHNTYEWGEDDTIVL